MKEFFIEVSLPFFLWCHEETKMKEFFIEVSLPPSSSHKVRVFTEWNKDTLSPNLIALYRVKAKNKEDAMSQVMLGKAFTMIAPSGRQLKMASE